MTAATTTLYESDFVQWADTTAQLLRERRLDDLDWENLIEEVEDLGGRHRDALYSNLKVVLMHLLKWQYQTERLTNSWKASIREHRQRIRRSLGQSPSLKPYLQDCFDECYTEARELAADETGLPMETFPTNCPYSIADVLNTNFFPQI